MDHLSNFFAAQERTRHARTKLDLAHQQIKACEMEQRCYEVISQHEPLASLSIDREAGEKLMRFILSGRVPA